MADSGFSTVDSHVHVQPWEELHRGPREMLERGLADKERVLRVMADPAEMVRLLDSEGVAIAGIINYVAPEVMGFSPKANEFVMRCKRQAPDRIIAFGGIHPPMYRKRKEVAEEMDRIIALGLDGIKIHPPHQLFPANGYRDGGPLPALAEVYERAQAAGIPVMIHTGTSIFPGARSKYGDPIAVDDVAIDFPRLQIILAHGGRPLWMETCQFLLRRFRNVWMDISSIPPKRVLEYFPRLEELADRVLFGSDWPAMGVKGMRANADAIDALSLTVEARRRILGGNSRALFRRN